MSKSIHLIGNAHLDPTWLWRWQEGCSEVLQTFRSALDRLNEYNDFIFTCSSAAHYKWVEDIDPEMFKEIQQRVKQGRWVIVNGWWVQADCNMPSCESYARQALYSQLYYYEKFGKICHTGYNVDSFGHNGMMPQLLKKGGMTAYVMMRPNKKENPDIPENLFWWDSADGSRILTYRIPSSYGVSGSMSLTKEIERLSERIEETGHGMMLFYGVGNHGGGPTKSDLNFLISNMKAEGYHELEFSSPDDYFNEMCQEELDLPIFTDDLQHHASGCYSATSLIKHINRKSENLLGAAEKWDTVSAIEFNSKPSSLELKEAWLDVCYNQFHDIMCGCSIMESYEDAKEFGGHALTLAARAYNNATLRISRNIDTWIDGVSDAIDEEVRHHTGAHQNIPRPVVVFNPTSFAIELPVRAYHPSSSVKDSDGKPVVFQNVRSSRSNDTHLDTAFLANVPPLGYAVYWLTLDISLHAEDLVKPPANFTLENEHLKVKFDKATGFISSLINKESGTEYCDDKFLAIPTVINDDDTDTWAHNRFTFHDIKGLMELVSIEKVEAGALQSVIRTKHKFNESYLTQEFILAKNQKTIRVECKALWQEDFTMLKMAFPLEGTDAISTYEIPSGFIKRPVNGEEEPSLSWADLTLSLKDGNRAGITVMSDSKYSYDCPGNELRLTCLRNVIFADHYSPRPDADFNFTDEGMQRFVYGIYVHEGEAEASDAAKEAHLLNNLPNIAVIAESYHKGNLPQKKSYMTVNAENVIVTAVKLCEDNSGDLIIRLYECSGKATRCMLMSELFDNGFWFDIGKSEIKTFRVQRDGKVLDVNFLEGIVR